MDVAKTNRPFSHHYLPGPLLDCRQHIQIIVAPVVLHPQHRLATTERPFHLHHHYPPGLHREITEKCHHRNPGTLSRAITVHEGAMPPEGGVVKVVVVVGEVDVAEGGVGVEDIDT